MLLTLKFFTVDKGHNENGLVSSNNPTCKVILFFNKNIKMENGLSF